MAEKRNVLRVALNVARAELSKIRWQAEQAIAAIDAVNDGELTDINKIADQKKRLTAKAALIKRRREKEGG